MEDPAGEGPFTARLRVAVQRGELAEADEWFGLAASPLLHPEMATRQPDAESYNLMIRACARAGNLAWAEKYCSEMAAKGLVPRLRTSTALVRACVECGEARRGHRWCGALVGGGCAECPGRCSPGELRGALLSGALANRDLRGLMDAVLALSRALADAGNTRSASGWLQYLAECGMRPEDDHAGTWGHVRAAHPPAIVDSVLSGESSCGSYAGTPKAPYTQPHKLGGEDGAQEQLPSELSTRVHSGSARSACSASSA